MISAGEKLKLAKKLAELKRQLLTETSGIKKLRLAKEFKLIRDQILGKVTQAAQNLYDQLKSGELNSLSPDRFISSVREIISAKLAGLDDVKIYVRQYIDAHKETEQS